MDHCGVSQDNRMAGAGKNLKDDKFQPLCHGKLNQFAQSDVPLYSEENFEKGIVASYIA